MVILTGYIDRESKGGDALFFFLFFLSELDAFSLCELSEPCYHESPSAS